MSTSTPLEKLKVNLKHFRASGSAKEPVVLLSTGSLNPVHRMHVDLFAAAKKSLEGIPHMET